MVGIYKITNIQNGKVYIGQSIHIERRFSEHKYSLLHDSHDNRHLQNAWNKYGEDSFKFEVVEECDATKLDERETYWKLYYDPHTYNLGHTRGHGTASEETKRKIGLAFKGDKNPSKRADVRMKISESRKGHQVSLETRSKISDSLTGRKREKFSATHLEHLIESSPNKREVAQFSKQGDLMKIWDSINAAARFYKISQANISDCCLGNQKTAKGFVWKYYDEVHTAV